MTPGEVMKDQSRIDACLAAAQADISRIFRDNQVPDEYRTRLTAYIQCWYLDQGKGSNGICLLRRPGELPVEAVHPG